MIIFKPNSVKLKIRNLNKKAIKNGEIKKKSACENCKEIKPIEVHHNNYRDYKAISFLCRSCRAKANRKRYNNISIIWINLLKSKLKECKITEKQYEVQSKYMSGSWKKFHKYFRD